MRLLKGEFTMNENKKYRVTDCFNNSTYSHDVENEKELENIYDAFDKGGTITIIADDEDRKILDALKLLRLRGLKSKDFRK